MNRKTIFFVLLSAMFAVQAFARDGRVDFVAADGRFVIYGDYSKHFKVGDMVQVRRDDRVVGVSEVSALYPTYMMMSPISTGSGVRVRVGDLVERVAAGPDTVVEFDTDVGVGAGKAEVRVKIGKVEAGGYILSYGDLADAGFKPGALVEILRDGKVIGAAEVMETGSHISRMKLVGTAGADIRVGDYLRIPSAVLEQVSKGKVIAIKEKKKIKKKKKSEETKVPSEDEEENEESETESDEGVEKKIEGRAEEQDKKKEDLKKKEPVPIEKRLEALRKK